MSYKQEIVLTSKNKGPLFKLVFKVFILSKMCKWKTVLVVDMVQLNIIKLSSLVKQS